MIPAPHFPLRIFYDGACPVCSREIAHYLRRDRQGLLVAIDISADGFNPERFGISLASFMYELHAIDQSGRIYRGVEAFCAIWRAFSDSPGYRMLTAVVGRPPVNWFARWGYYLFARLRPSLPGRSSACTAGVCRFGPAVQSAGKERMMNTKSTGVGMPIAITLEPGVYYRCTCGRSQHLPFCDESHRGAQGPLRFEITERRKVYLCSCGKSGRQPFCDSRCGVVLPTAEE